jgi:hypothetical protein
MTEIAGSPESAAEALHRELLTAWNNQDARAYAALFTKEATLVGFDGGQVAGAAVEEHLAGVFADHRTATYVWRTDEVRQLADGPGAVPRPGGPGRAAHRRDAAGAAREGLRLVAARGAGAHRAVQVGAEVGEHRAHAPDRVADAGRDRLAGALAGRRAQAPRAPTGSGDSAQFGQQVLALVGGAPAAREVGLRARG